MSRYNGRWDLVKPFYDVFFLVIVIPVAVSVGLVVYTYWRLLRDHETALAKVMYLLCETTSHDWADEDDYGVEPVCLKCGTERDRDDRGQAYVDPLWSWLLVALLVGLLVLSRVIGQL